MDTGIIAGSVLLVVASAFAFANRRPQRTAAAPMHEVSPVDEADRILAHRYARGEITFEQYDRMRCLLRR
jgi:uncharacterized membrane protein